MLKKIFIISIGLAGFTNQLLHGLDQLNKAKEQITKGKNNLVQTARDLKGSYDESQNGMLKEIKLGLTQLGDFKKQIDVACSAGVSELGVDVSKIGCPTAETLRALLAANSAIPPIAFIAAPLLVITVDLPETLQKVRNLLNSADSTLKTINNAISPRMNDLNYGIMVFNEQKKVSEPSATPVDPKGIYKQLDQAIKAFDDVEKKIDEILDIFKQASEAI